MFLFCSYNSSINQRLTKMLQYIPVHLQSSISLTRLIISTAGERVINSGHLGVISMQNNYRNTETKKNSVRCKTTKTKHHWKCFFKKPSKAFKTTPKIRKMTWETQKCHKKMQYKYRSKTSTKKYQTTIKNCFKNPMKSKTTTKRHKVTSRRHKTATERCKTKSKKKPRLTEFSSCVAGIRSLPMSEPMGLFSWLHYIQHWSWCCQSSKQKLVVMCSVSITPLYFCYSYICTYVNLRQFWDLVCQSLECAALSCCNAVWTMAQLKKTEAIRQTNENFMLHVLYMF